MKEKSMSTLSPYRMSISDNFGDKTGAKSHELSGPSLHPFISLLDLIAQIYKVILSLILLSCSQSSICYYMLYIELDV